MKSADLTAGELLLVDRRRRGETQAQAARRLCVTDYEYRRWEDDATPAASRPRVLRGVKAHEECVVRRRRAGMQAGELARVLGLSRWWLTRMERGEIPCAPMLAFWHARTERQARAMVERIRSRGARARKA